MCLVKRQLSIDELPPQPFPGERALKDIDVRMSEEEAPVGVDEPSGESVCVRSCRSNPSPRAAQNNRPPSPLYDLDGLQYPSVAIGREAVVPELAAYIAGGVLTASGELRGGVLARFYVLFRSCQRGGRAMSKPVFLTPAASSAAAAVSSNAWNVDARSVGMQWPKWYAMFRRAFSIMLDAVGTTV